MYLFISNLYNDFYRLIPYNSNNNNKEEIIVSGEKIIGGMDTQFPQIPKSPKVHNPANQQIKKCAEKSSRKSSVIHNLVDSLVLNYDATALII